MGVVVLEKTGTRPRASKRQTLSSGDIFVLVETFTELEPLPMSVSRRVALGSMFTILAGASTALAQVGHPAKGSWSGYWGTSDATKKRILLLLDWRNNEIVGTINPGPNAVKIDKAALDVTTWTLTLEAQMPATGGARAPFVTTGKLENLGSWTNRRYSGTYVFGSERGTFTVTLN
jgi:hypothetical protein